MWHSKRLSLFPLLLVLVIGVGCVGVNGQENLLVNPTFEGAETQMPPPGWTLWGSLDNGHKISVIHPDDPERRALLIEDMVNINRGLEGEIGLQQTVNGGPGHYRLSVEVGAVAGSSPDRTALQIRFLPSNELKQVDLTPTDTEGFEVFSVEGEAPAGTTQVRMYLYTFSNRTPKIRLRSAKLERITPQQALAQRYDGVIGGYAPITFDLSKASIESPPLSELRARIPEGRPRLFATPDTIDELRNKRRTSPLAGLVFNNLRIQALTAIGLPMPPYPPDARPGGVLDITAWRRGIEIANDIVNRLDSLGFVYLLTGDEEIGQAGKKLLLHVAEWDPYGNSGRAKNDEISMRLLYTMSRAYDWLHPLFSDEERTIIQKAMRERGNDVYTTMRRIRFEENMIDNHLVRTLGFLGQAAIAFMGELPEAEVWFDYVVGLLLTKFPPFGGDEGGWSQGVSYWQSYINWMFEFMDALEIVTGLDLYQMPFFRNTGYFKLYAHPPESKFGAFGDHSDVPPDAGSARVVGRLALRYKDPALQWYVDKISHMGRVPELPMNSFVGYVRAPGLGETLPDPALPEDFPQSRLFSDIGWAIMNVNLADWKNNVHVKFKSSPFGSFNHSHAEQNSFMIEAYGSPLAIPSGYYPWYGSPHHSQWTWQSKSKNTILVNGLGQVAQSIDAKGQILDHSFGDQFDYVLGDATQAYMGRVQRFLRQLLFIKPNLIVIYDQLENHGRASTYDWLLHSVGPQTADEAANRVFVEGETAHMWVSFVTPDELSFHITDQFPVAPEEREANKPNQWHMTATARTTDGVGRFLTVLVPRPNSRVDEAPPATEQVAASNGHAARIEMDGKRFVVAFRDDPNAPLVVEDRRTDATAVVAWESPADGEHGHMAINGTYLQRDDALIWEASDQVTFAARWTAAGDDKVDLWLQLEAEPSWLRLRVPASVGQVYVNGELFEAWSVEGDLVNLKW